MPEFRRWHCKSLVAKLDALPKFPMLRNFVRTDIPIHHVPIALSIRTLFCRAEAQQELAASADHVASGSSFASAEEELDDAEQLEKFRALRMDEYDDDIGGDRAGGGGEDDEEDDEYAVSRLFCLS
jgi:hypothetical protein